MAESRRAASWASQWRWLSWVLMAIAGVAILVFAAAGDTGPATDRERAAQLAGTIRCPQCRGQSVADSDVTIAREIRADIAKRVDAGQSDDEIRQVYIDRFGRSVVLTPDATGFTGLVWIVPVIAAALGLAAVGLALARWRSGGPGALRATEEDRALVDELRKRPRS